MLSLAFYIIGIMLIAYAVYFYFYLNKRKKLKTAFESLDVNSEMAKANSYVSDLLNKDYQFIAKQMKDIPIDAFISATTEYTAKDIAKDTAKDFLKSAATLGAVKYRTVQTPKFLIISGTDLHLLDTDAEGDFSDHLVFDKSRLRSSSIEEETVKNTLQKQMQAGGLHDIRKYKLRLATDGEDIILNFYDFILADPNNAAMYPFGQPHHCCEVRAS